MNGGGETEEKKVGMSWRALTKWNGFRERSLSGFIRDLYYLNSFSVLSQGLLNISGVEQWECGLVSVEAGRDMPPIWRNVSSRWLKEELRRVSVVSWNPVIENSENLGKADQKVKVTCSTYMCNFFFLFYPMPLQ